MAKIITDSIIRGIKGKICSHDDTFLATRNKSKTIYTSRICNPSEADPTDRQLAVQNNFRLRTQAVSKWLEANRPSSTQPQGSEEYQKAQAAYAKSSIDGFFAYCNKVLIANGTIKVDGLVDPATLAPTTGTKPGAGTGTQTPSNPGTDRDGNDYEP